MHGYSWRKEINGSMRDARTRAKKQRVPEVEGCTPISILPDGPDFAKAGATIRRAAQFRNAPEIPYRLLNLFLESSYTDHDRWLQQTQAFRAQKVWMTLRHHGLGGYRRAVEADITLARYLAGRLDESPDWELCKPIIKYCCFRFVPTGLKENPDALNSPEQDYS